jgi:hypothetical protein
LAVRAAFPGTGGEEGGLPFISSVSELEETIMKLKHGSLAVVTAALLSGSATLAIAKGDSAFERPCTAVTWLSTTDHGMSDRGGITIRLAQQANSNQGQNSNEGGTNCPPEHKAAGHC